MAKFHFEGVDKLIEQYQKLEANTEEVIGKAIYNGAGVVNSWAIFYPKVRPNIFAWNIQNAQR